MFKTYIVLFFRIKGNKNAFLEEVLHVIIEECKRRHSLMNNILRQNLPNMEKEMVSAFSNEKVFVFNQKSGHSSLAEGLSPSASVQMIGNFDQFAHCREPNQK